MDFQLSYSGGCYFRYLSYLITDIFYTSLQISFISRNRYLSNLITDINDTSLQISLQPHYRYLSYLITDLSYLNKDISYTTLQISFILHYRYLSYLNSFENTIIILHKLVFCLVALILEYNNSFFQYFRWRTK